MFNIKLYTKSISRYIQTCGWALRFELPRTYVRPCRPEIFCAQLLLHPLMDFVHTHIQWPKNDMKMTVNIGFCNVASFTWVIGLCHSFYYIAYRGEILCTQLLLHPLTDFVNTNTQWPTWHEDEFAMLQVLHELWDFVMGASVSYRHISSLK